MPEPRDLATLLKSNAGPLIGKTRLQKTAYFLERLGVGFGFDFSYHHYGPYSEELSVVADDACALGIVDLQWATSQAGVPYAIFRDTGGTLPAVDAHDAQRRSILEVLKRHSAVELELAATADYLAENGYGPAAWEEAKRRKAVTRTADRAQGARRLLEELKQLAPVDLVWKL